MHTFQKYKLIYFCETPYLHLSNEMLRQSALNLVCFGQQAIWNCFKIVKHGLTVNKCGEWDTSF